MFEYIKNELKLVFQTQAHSIIWIISLFIPRLVLKMKLKKCWIPSAIITHYTSYIPVFVNFKFRGGAAVISGVQARQTDFGISLIPQQASFRRHAWTSAHASTNIDLLWNWDKFIFLIRSFTKNFPHFNMRFDFLHHHAFFHLHSAVIQNGLHKVHSVTIGRASAFFNSLVDFISWTEEPWNFSKILS